MTRWRERPALRHVTTVVALALVLGLGIGTGLALPVHGMPVATLPPPDPAASGNSTCLVGTCSPGASFNWSLNGTNLTVNDTSWLPPSFVLHQTTVALWWLSWGDGSAIVLNGTAYAGDGNYSHNYTVAGTYEVLEGLVYVVTVCLEFGGAASCQANESLSIASANVTVQG